MPSSPPRPPQSTVQSAQMRPPQISATDLCHHRSGHHSEQVQPPQSHGPGARASERQGTTARHRHAHHGALASRRSDARGLRAHRPPPPTSTRLPRDTTPSTHPPSPRGKTLSPNRRARDARDDVSARATGEVGPPPSGTACEQPALCTSLLRARAQYEPPGSSPTGAAAPPPFMSKILRINGLRSRFHRERNTVVSASSGYLRARVRARRCA